MAGSSMRLGVARPGDAEAVDEMSLAGQSARPGVFPRRDFGEERLAD